ncbi:MAG: serine--tRNA ligase [Candidatus Babeliales bacterium]
MINLHLLREKFSYYKERINAKDPSYDVDLLLHYDTMLRSLQQDVEQLRSAKNALAEQGKRGITEELRQRSLQTGKELEEKEAMLREIKQQHTLLYLFCPNIPEEEVPLGDKTDNQVVKMFGEKPTFSFEPKHHVELVKQSGWVDFDAGVQLAGAQFVVYHEEAASLLYTLALWMLRHNRDHGYTVALPPAVVNETTLTMTGNLPKFEEQLYRMERDNMYMIPTAEVGLASLYRNTLFETSELPVRKTAWTSCFRREAGGYGAHERGLIRIHQFEKVELFTFCTPEQAAQEHERMIACAESILQKLGLHYRVSLLAAQDCSFASAKTYDIEVWLPGQKEYYEVASCSNCTDFQARRGSIRYRAHAREKSSFVYTLNASSLALPRLMVALIETYQQKDGTIQWPDVLIRERVW